MILEKKKVCLRYQMTIKSEESILKQTDDPVVMQCRRYPFEGQRTGRTK